MSGIAAIFFSGLCHAHYSMYSVSANAQISLKLFFETASFLSETCVCPCTPGVLHCSLADQTQALTASSSDLSLLTLVLR